MSHSKTPNKLVHSSSPYLKQHAYNPVQWYPWGEEALQRAKDEDKPLIISIGYSACHWCHVMERESFENDEVAHLMNTGFICIKVDREERPDVDQIYMEAIQTMGLNGGWPLNVFALPDQRPFYGGTYFQPRQWLQILGSIIDAYRDKRTELEKSAKAFGESLAISDTEKYGLENHGFLAEPEQLSQMVLSMVNHFDAENGGLKRAPKFPNPSIWKFLLTANSIVKSSDVHDQIMLTLRKMAKGGIYDQIGGGFARYSVDERWFAPHFEKMLYDNAQLISLYSMAYQVDGDERFKEVVYESIEFVSKDLTSPEYGFYSALDADTEGEEGNFYVWTSEELDRIIGEDAILLKKYYLASKEGNWERGLNILHTDQTPGNFSSDLGVDETLFREKLERAKKKLLVERKKRVNPGLDDKILTSWNALMLKGLIDAFHAFGENSFLELGLKNASFIQDNLIKDGVVYRNYSKVNTGTVGFLDDYAFTIDAFLSLYQTSFERKWLDLAADLVGYVIEHFYDSSEELFFYTDGKSEQLIARKKELFDNVIPASNSVMAQNLYFLGNLLDEKSYLELSENMISKIAPMIKSDPQYLTNWGTLYSYRVQPTAEIAIVGKDYLTFAEHLQKKFYPNKIISAAEETDDLPFLHQRKAINDETTIYVCYDKSCKLPVQSVNEALLQLEGVI